MAQGLAEALYKKIPVNMRIFGESLLGSKAPITEKDFSNKDLQFIKQAYLKKKAINDDNESLLRRELVGGKRMSLNEQGQLVDDTASYKKDLGRAIKTYADTKGKTSLGYNDYGGSAVPQDAGWLEQIKASFGANPAFRTGTTLGQFNVHEGPKGGLTVKDKYNWEGADASIPEIISAFASSAGSLEELGNVAMRTFRPNVSRDVNIKLPRDTK